MLDRRKASIAGRRTPGGAFCGLHIKGTTESVRLGIKSCKHCMNTKNNASTTGSTFLPDCPQDMLLRTAELQDTAIAEMRDFDSNQLWRLLTYKSILCLIPHSFLGANLCYRRPKGSKPYVAFTVTCPLELELVCPATQSRCVLCGQLNTGHEGRQHHFVMVIRFLQLWSLGSRAAEPNCPNLSRSRLLSMHPPPLVPVYPWLRPRPCSPLFALPCPSASFLRLPLAPLSWA